MKTVTIEASGGIGVTIGQDGPALPILLVVHGAKLDGTHETVRAELTDEEAREILRALQCAADEKAGIETCADCGALIKRGVILSGVRHDCPAAAARAQRRYEARLAASVCEDCKAMPGQFWADVYPPMETLGKLVFTPELARDWGHFFSAFANRCSQEDAVKKRAAEGLCGSPSCKRKLVAGTERCRKCGERCAGMPDRGCGMDRCADVGDPARRWRGLSASRMPGGHAPPLRMGAHDDEGGGDCGRRPPGSPLRHVLAVDSERHSPPSARRESLPGRRAPPGAAALRRARNHHRPRASSSVRRSTASFFVFPGGSIGHPHPAHFKRRPHGR